jgi:hypothetical protein
MATLEIVVSVATDSNKKTFYGCVESGNKSVAVIA